MTTRRRTRSGVLVGVGEAVVAAHREAHEVEAVDAPGLAEGFEVVDVVLRAVGGGVGGVAVAALVGGEDVPAFGERRGHVVPDVGVAGEAVEEDEGRVRGVAPLEVVEGEVAEGEGVVAAGVGHGLIVGGP